MKNKRIGTISMGIVLIAFGLLIFFAQFNKVSALKLAVNIWPGVLILLGGEILWANYKSKDEEIKFRYDIFSIFIVFVIVMTSIGIYGMMEIGLLDRIRYEVARKTYNYELPLEDYAVDENIKNIIINGDRVSNLSIRSDSGNKIVSTGNININTDSQEKADKIFKENRVNIERIDNTLYISYKEDDSHNYYGASLNLVVPSHVDVEVANGGNIDVVMDKVDGNWIIDGGDVVKMRLKKDSNIKVQAMVNREYNLGGNVAWKDTKIGTEEDYVLKGELVFGEGIYSLNILNIRDIVIDEI
ncbi:hypothetical protein ACTNDY_07810 [Tissierellaceae bacterium HCP3S3_D8]